VVGWTLGDDAPGNREEACLTHVYAARLRVPTENRSRLRPSGMRTQTKAVLWVGTFAAVVASACSSGPTSPSASSLSVGQWSGTTTQGASIAFTVSSDEVLTTIAVGYAFNGCSGTQTFADLSVPTAPNVTCVPGPCSGTISTYRAIAYSSGLGGTGPSTTVNGLFLPGGRAQGQISFRDYPGCGTAAGVEWTATRR
jgi:hypothetical protein